MNDEMKIEFIRSSLKFIEKLRKKDKEKVRLKLKSLLISLEKQGIIPFRELDIKKLNRFFLVDLKGVIINFQLL